MFSLSNNESIVNHDSFNAFYLYSTKFATTLSSVTLSSDETTSNKEKNHTKSQITQEITET